VDRAIAGRRTFYKSMTEEPQVELHFALNDSGSAGQFRSIRSEPKRTRPPPYGGNRTVTAG